MVRSPSPEVGALDIHSRVHCCTNIHSYIHSFIHARRRTPHTCIYTLSHPLPRRSAPSSSSSAWSSSARAACRPGQFAEGRQVCALYGVLLLSVLLIIITIIITTTTQARSPQRNFADSYFNLEVNILTISNIEGSYFNLEVNKQRLVTFNINEAKRRRRGVGAPLPALALPPLQRVRLHLPPPGGVAERAPQPCGSKFH